MEADAFSFPLGGWHDPATRTIRPIGALLALVFIASGLPPSEDSIAASAAPSLRALKLHPFTVQGQHFNAGERVRVVLLARGEWTRRVTASAAGSFSATFRDVVVDRCRGFVVRALGALGSRALLRGGVGQGSAGAEEAWLELLRLRGLEPARQAVVVSIKGSAPELTVSLTLPAGAARELAFPDALYGAIAYAFERMHWRRVDTAEVRAQLAPVLEPGESATVKLPVQKAASYRVLVPVEGRAAWGCK